MFKNNTIHIITARWWARSIIFIVIGLILFRIFNQISSAIFINYIEFSAILTSVEFYIFISLLISAITIESLRIESKFYAFGLLIDKNSIIETIKASLLALGIIAIILVSVFISGKNIRYVFDSHWASFFSITIYIFINAASEEFLFRGTIFQSIVQRFGAIKATFVFSVLFGLAHIFNPHLNFLSLINIVIASILISLIYLKTLSIIPAIFFHFFWNWGEAAILGSPVSGFQFDIPIFQIDFNHNSSILYGGNFGIEAGILVSLGLIAALFVVSKYSNVSVYLASLHFKRRYLESLLLENTK